MRTYTRVYFYLTARLNCRELTSGEIDRINSYVLREDLRYNHADKMTLIEYPVMTARQAERRWLEIQSIGGIREHAHFRLVYDKYSVIAYVPQ